MSNLKPLEISDNFTIEDIHKIREHSYYQRLEDPEGWRREMKESAAKMQTEIEKIREQIQNVE